MIEAIAEQDKNRGKLSQEDYEFWRNLGLEYYEKQERKTSSILDLQYDIIRLQTTDSNKEIIFYKYMELKEKTEHDDEYYKLKKWIKY